MKNADRLDAVAQVAPELVDVARRPGSGRPCRRSAIASGRAIARRRVIGTSLLAARIRAAASRCLAARSARSPGRARRRRATRRRQAATAPRRAPAMVGCWNSITIGTSTCSVVAQPAVHLHQQQRVAAELEEVVVRCRRGRRRAPRARSRRSPLESLAAAPRRAPRLRPSRVGRGQRARGRPCRSGSAAARRAARSRGAPCRLGQPRRAARAASRPAVGARRGSGSRDVGHEPRVAGVRPRAPRRPPRAPPACAASAASISPSSMRKPRIFTWWSMRPRYSISPSGSWRAQVAGAVEPRARRRRERIGHEPLRGQLRRGRSSRAPTCTPPMYSSPATPIGTGSSARSRT